MYQWSCHLPERSQSGSSSAKLTACNHQKKSILSGGTYRIQSLHSTIYQVSLIQSNLPREQLGKSNLYRRERESDPSVKLAQGDVKNSYCNHAYRCKGKPNPKKKKQTKTDHQDFVEH